MRNIQRRRSHLNFASALALATALTLQAEAAECPHADALGTSRVITVDAANAPRIIGKSFRQDLPLQDREVVLTFDDGPSAARDGTVLAALAEQCGRATANA